MKSYELVESGDVYVDCLWCRLVRDILAYAVDRCHVRYRRLPKRGWSNLNTGRYPIMSVKELTQENVHTVMNSDMKLWETSTTEMNGSSIVKAIILPYGIGEMRVEFQGVDSAIKRRAAAEQWGAMVRDRVKNAIDDAAITSRAQLAAAEKQAKEEAERLEQSNSGDSSGDEAEVGLRDQPSVQEASEASTVQTHAQDAEGDNGPSGTDFAARAEWLRGRIGEGERKLKEQRRELKALEAALEVLGGGDD